ncbi:EscU/YscU/HrcU family type III secretion system export apparatus switch protein [Roseomonas terrae]|uniref:EscU/YscU/HrcU family type III secretion system export apparatus switch protein n=1 Tax=Neoroseomonas terrae TaxID=424799 RepID=A0ABS5EE69_9PROT|nr:EscU/YscU/HrcU family type III secretion system export apparatus switch protein [Neoroseomonas terrae]MBR0649320.1 EscU/YscU/HrcU family type III secretion system export apparatus switch protein [Neoroseomonas terrae]
MAGQDDGSEAEDKTEAASPRRLEKAREDGQVALSRDLVGFGALSGGVLGLVLSAPLAVEMLRGLAGAMARAHAIPVMESALEMARLGLMAALPVALLTALGAIAATFLQTRMLVSAKGLAPQLSRLNPFASLKRIFGPDGAVELLRTIIKLGLVGAALWHAMGDPAELPRLLFLPAAALLARLGEAAADLTIAALLAFAAVAALDWLWVRHRHLQRLRMSRQDQKEEARESEGDPHVKARQRQIRQQRARGRMMAAVPKAAVVITNPTHFAVALAYEQGGEAAPRIVAKGADEVAARIRAAAGEAGVPVVSNPPLARALFRLDLDTEIPPEHYQAVAEIIAYVWRLGGRGQAG